MRTVVCPSQQGISVGWLRLRVPDLMVTSPEAESDESDAATTLCKRTTVVVAQLLVSRIYF
jgi:hypothetical protein